MKKSEKIFLILLVLLTIFSFLMLIALSIEGAEIHGNFQFGYIEEIESFETEINIQFLLWRWLTLYGGINVLMEHYEKLKFHPYRNVYITGVKMNITENLYIDLYSHCAHMVIYDYRNQFYDRLNDGNKNKISIGIEW